MRSVTAARNAKHYGIWPSLTLPVPPLLACDRFGWKADIASPAQLGFKWAMIIAALAVLAFQSSEPSAATQRPSLQCDVGPLEKTFGGYPWLVYSCSDGASLVVVSDAGNPASPFYFMLQPNGDGYAMSGEGSGSKEASSAAFEDLKRLGAPDIAAMLAETKLLSAPRR